MAKTVWGVSLTHDAGVCQVTDGKIDWFLSEERASRYKHDIDPTFVLDYLEEHTRVDKWVITGLLAKTWEPDYIKDWALRFDYKVAKWYKKLYGIVNDHISRVISTEHHIFHAACGYYNSGFDEAVVVIADGMGNPVQYDDDAPTCHEVESVYHVKNGDFKCVWKNVTPTFIDCDRPYPKCDWINQNAEIGIGMVYSAMSVYLGFGELGSGILMGLAAYGKPDPNIKPFLLHPSVIDQDLFHRVQYGAKFIPYDYVKFEGEVDEMSPDHPKFQPLANLAWRLQLDFEIYMTHLLKTASIQTGCKNIVLSGGCALNCVANYEYLKHLPDDVKLYVEPVSDDSGIPIGAAYMGHEL